MGHVFSPFIEIKISKTHSRTINFDGNRCGSSDLSIIVDYKIYSPKGIFTTSKTFTFIQLKLGRYDLDWNLSGKQLYFMRYWPPFKYKNTSYSLEVSGKYPDTCSFYLFMYKDKRDSDYIFKGYGFKRYSVNAFALSTIKLEYIYGYKFDPDTLNIIFKDQKLRDYNYKRFVSFGWMVLLQNLGTYSIEAEKFIDAMFPELSNDDPLKDGSNSSDELPSVGLKMTVGTKFE